MEWRARWRDAAGRALHSLGMRTARLLSRWLSPGDLGGVAGETLEGVLARVPEEQRVTFLVELTQELLHPMLSGLERRQRAQLMNALLPLVAREFPLAELDFLSHIGDAAPERDGVEKPIAVSAAYQSGADGE